MSADNWSKCPNCLEIKNVKIKKLDKQISDGYGILDESKYTELQKKRSGLMLLMAEETLREDYEMYMKHGLFIVNYYCHCSVCGWEWNYEREEQAL